MLGFEIKVNDGKLLRVASDGVLSVVMHVGENPEYDYMNVGGMDSRLYHFSWFGKDMESGDKVIIRVTEIDDTDPVLERFPHNRELVIKHYFQMKKELEEQGLI